MKNHRDRLWDEAHFLARVGHLPEDDDLDRVNCDKAGQPRHRACGVCEHQLPVFQCYDCFVKSSREVSTP